MGFKRIHSTHDTLPVGEDILSIFWGEKYVVVNEQYFVKLLIHAKVG